MKPDWGKSPEWANHLAMDSDGSWWWYEDQPTWNDLKGRWCIVGERRAMSDAEYAGTVRAVVGNGSLERRP